MEKTIILIHGISNQPLNWADDSVKHLSKYGDVVPFKWDDILNKNLEAPTFQALNGFSKMIASIVPNWKIADFLLRWTLDRGADLLGYAKVRKDAFNRLKSIVELATSDVCIVAHSLGTVLAYEFLVLHKKDQVKLLITLGSPLDRQPVKGRVLKRIGEVVELKQKWYNVYGTLDPVVSWLPFMKDQGAIQTFKPNKQHKLLGHNHGLNGYVYSLNEDDFSLT